MSTSFNVLDLIFFTFTIIFVLTAFFRGFVKEVFALFNWIVALTLSYLIAPYAVDFLEKHFDNKLAIDLSARSIIFVIVFFITAMSTSGLRDNLKDKIPSMFDKSLGVLFGFIKTLIIFGLILALYFNLYGFLLGNKLKDNIKTPDWLKDAKCYSLIKFSSDTLDPLVKKFFESMNENFDHVIPNSKELLDDKINEVIQNKIEEGIDASEIGKAPSNNFQDPGYNKKDIEKMNHLIDIIEQ